MKSGRACGAARQSECEKEGEMRKDGAGGARDQLLNSDRIDCEALLAIDSAWMPSCC